MTDTGPDTAETGQRPQVRPPLPPGSSIRQLVAASIGNAAEWYDWFSCTVAQAVYLSAPYLHLRRSARSRG